MEVIVLTRKKEIPNPDKNIQYVQFDFSNPKDVQTFQPAFNGTEIFFHLAAYTSPEMIEKSEFSNEGFDSFQSQVSNPIRFLETIADNLKKVVFASSIMVYPLVAKDPFKENRDENPNEFYGVNKIAFEKCAQFWAGYLEKEFVSTRISSVYGDKMEANSTLGQFIEKARKDHNIPVFSDGSPSIDWVYIDDAIQGLLLAANHKGSGVFNIGSTENISNLKLAEEVVRILESKSKIELLPEKKIEYRKRMFSINKAVSKLGYSPQYNFEKGLTSMLDLIKKTA